MRGNSPRRKYNVRDVAKLAGVSVATVSRVLNNPSIVTKEKRDKVERAIETLQFVPSSSARAINSGRSHLVGALVPTLDHAIFARYIDALETELDRAGLSLILATTSYSPHQEMEKTRRLLNLGVEGLFVSGITRDEEFKTLVNRYQVPVVSTSYYDAAYQFPTIGYDNAQAAKVAWDHLASLGHSDIAVLTGPPDQSDRTRARLEGLRPLVQSAGQIFESELNYAAAGQAVRRIMEDLPEATAVLCLSDVLAQGVLLQLSKSGIGVPQKLSVMGIDDLPSSESFDPPLTSVHLPVGQMGQAAARALAHWIETGTQPNPTEIKSRISIRGSTGRVVSGLI